ncbi:hypothetical protein ILUMI_17874, partial [Ignelater luminosus]
RKQKEWEQEKKLLTDRIENLEAKWEIQEKREKKNNIIIKGLQTNKENIEEEVKKLINIKIGVNAGDFNAKIGEEERNYEIAGKESLHKKSNKNGQRLIDLTAGNRMIIKTTHLKHNDIHKPTWISPDKKTLNQIDHSLIERKHAKCVLDVRTYRGADIGSGHMLVIAKIKQEIPITINKRNNKLKKWNIEALKKDENKEKYNENTKKIIITKEKSTDVNKERGSIRTAIEASTELLKSTKRETRKDWFDDECRKVVQERKQARMKMLKDNTKERIEQYEQIRNSTQTKIRNKKRETQKAKSEEMEEHHRNRNTKLFHKNLKEEKKVALTNHQGEIWVDTTSMLNIWENFFLNTLTNNECKTENEQLHQNNQDKQKLEEPAKKEIIEIIKKSKNNKSPSEDSITIEQIKYSSEKIFDRIYNLIKQIWKKECMPKEWSQALIHPVHKKGSTQNPENYRPISLL